MYFAIIAFCHTFLGSFFYKNMVVIYLFLLEEAMYCYCYLRIVIVIYVLLFLSMYCYC